MDGSEPDMSSQLQKVGVENKLQTPSTVETEMDQECRSSETSSLDKSQLIVDSEHGCQNPEDVCSNDDSRLNFEGEECASPKVSSVNGCELHVDGDPESQSPNVSESGDAVAVKYQGEIYVMSKVGMEFEIEDQAYKCYSRYAVLGGFSIRKDFVNKSRINGAVVSRRYACYRQGYRPAKHNANVREPQQETRTGCLAHMTIARQPNGKLRVTHFETQHDHEFVTSSTAHMLPSQKRLTFAQAVEAELCNGPQIDGLPKLGMGFESEELAYGFYNIYVGRVGFSVRKDYVNRSKVDGAVASRRFT